MSEKYKGWLREIASQVRESQIWQYSTFITFYFLVSLFPIFVAVVNSIEVNNQSLEPFIEVVTQIFPQMISQRLVIDLQIIFERSNVGIYVISLLASIWTISILMTSITVSLNKAYGVRHRRNIIILRIFSFFMTIILAVFYTIIVYVAQSLDLGSLFNAFLFVFATFTTFCFLYYSVSNARQPFKYVIPGAVLGTIAVMIASGIYFALLYFLPVESIFYTLIGSFIIILEVIHKIWLFMLGGAVLNSYFVEKEFGEIPEKNEESKFIRLLVKIRFLEELDE